MTSPIKQPWAVLLCKFADYTVDPPNGRLGIPFDTTSPLLFTNVGIFTQNVVNYFWAMSHQHVDLSDSQVFGWYTLDTKAADLIAPDPLPASWAPTTTRDAVIAKAKAAALKAKVDLESYYGVVVIMNLAAGISQGGTVSSGGKPSPWVFADFRFVNDNGTDTFGHEMCHGYGLQHSRAENPTFNPVNCMPPGPDYRDPWDIMSAGCTYMARDPNFAVAGPALNAAYMRKLGWLEESRVWHSPSTSFQQVVTLRPLHNLNTVGDVAAELPMASDPTGKTMYLVEYRKRESWDAGIPASCVLIHRIAGANTYLQFGATNAPDLTTGSVFVDREYQGGTLVRFSRLKVLAIDDASSTATIELVYSTAPLVPKVTIFVKNQDSACNIPPVFGSTVTLGLDVIYVAGTAGYGVTWSVWGGASAAPGETFHSTTFSVIAPSNMQPVMVSVQVTFDDGTVVAGSIAVNCLTQDEADLRLFLCQAKKERRLPNPWWEWDPARLKNPIRRFPRETLVMMEQRTKKMAAVFRKLLKLT